jgi:hypothetical protein
MHNVNADVNFYCISGRLQLIKKGLLSYLIQAKGEFQKIGFEVKITCDCIFKK